MVSKQDVIDTMDTLDHQGADGAWDYQHPG